MTMPKRIVILVAAIAFVVAACTSSNVFSLEVGDCFNDWEESTDVGTQEISNVPIVECSEPHDNEVYSVTSMPDGDYPGDSAVQDWTVTTCQVTFEDFVGTSYFDSALEIAAFWPSAESWELKDRDVVCFLWDPNFEKLEGSMGGTRV